MISLTFNRNTTQFKEAIRSQGDLNYRKTEKTISELQQDMRNPQCDTVIWAVSAQSLKTARFGKKT